MNIYDEALFHIATDTMTTRDVLEALYGRPSQATINHFLRTNEHLGGDWIGCGQMIVITPPERSAFAMLEQQMAIAARHVDAELSKLQPRERRLLAVHYVLLSNLSSCNGPRYGWATNRFHHHKKNLERCLGRLDALPEAVDGQAPRREQLLLHIQHHISALLRSRLIESGRKNTAIKANLGLAKGAVVHRWRSQIGPARTIASFKSHYAQMIKGAKSLARLGQVSLTLDVAVAEKKQLALFDSDGLPMPLGCSYGWPFDQDAYRLIISLEGGQSDFLRCSIVSGGADGLSGPVSDGETVFSRSYRKGY